MQALAVCGAAILLGTTAGLLASGTAQDDAGTPEDRLAGPSPRAAAAPAGLPAIADPPADRGTAALASRVTPASPHDVAAETERASPPEPEQTPAPVPAQPAVQDEPGTEPRGRALASPEEAPVDAPEATVAAAAAAREEPAVPSAAERASLQDDARDEWDEAQEAQDEAQEEALDEVERSPAAGAEVAAQSGDDRAVAAASGGHEPGPAGLMELMDRAVGPEEPPAAAQETAGGGESAPSARVAPSREEVQQALESVRDELAACADGTHGLLTLEIAFASSGRVRSVLVHGPFAGSAEGSCMARAARSARVAPFEDATFQVRYPFRL